MGGRARVDDPNASGQTNGTDWKKTKHILVEMTRRITRPVFDMPTTTTKALSVESITEKLNEAKFNWIIAISENVQHHIQFK